MSNVKETLTLAANYEMACNAIVKRAFVEAPPILLEKVYAIYKRAYLEYASRIKENTKNRILRQKKLLFSNQTNVWRNWIKNLPDETNHAQSYIESIIPKFKKFVGDENEYTDLE